MSNADYGRDYHSGALAERSRVAFQEWLQSFQFDTFCTITFERKVRYADTAIQKCMPILTSALSRGFCGAEEHYLGGWHVHAIGNIATCDLDSGEVRRIERGTLYQALKRFGVMRSVEAIGSHSAVTTYVTKYITKDLGGWDFWNLDKPIEGDVGFQSKMGLD